MVADTDTIFVLIDIVRFTFDNTTV